MPIQRIRGPGGRVGYRWGETGKLYTGPDARERAAAQARAIMASGYRSRKSRNGK